MSDDNGDGMVSAEEARGLLEKATPGPWRSGWDCADTGEDVPLIYSVHPEPGDYDGKVVFGMWYDGPRTACTEKNAALLAAAPDLARTVIALHGRPTEAQIRHDAERGVLLSLWAAIDGEQDGDAPGNRALRDNLVKRVNEQIEEAEARANKAERERDALRRILDLGTEDDPGTGECLAAMREAAPGDVERVKAYAAAWVSMCAELEAERDRLARSLAAIGALNPEGIPCGCWHGWAQSVGPSGEPDGVPCEDCGGHGATPGTGWLVLPADDAREAADAAREGSDG